MKPKVCCTHTQTHPDTLKHTHTHTSIVEERWLQISSCVTGSKETLMMCITAEHLHLASNNFHQQRAKHFQMNVPQTTGLNITQALRVNRNTVKQTDWVKRCLLLPKLAQKKRPFFPWTLSQMKFQVMCWWTEGPLGGIVSQRHWAGIISAHSTLDWVKRLCHSKKKIRGGGGGGAVGSQTAGQSSMVTNVEMWRFHLCSWHRTCSPSFTLKHISLIISANHWEQTATQLMTRQPSFASSVALT